MIEIGRHYTLAMLDLGDEGYEKGTIGVTVTGRDGSLLEVNGCEVINMASPLFHSLVDNEKQRAYFKRVEEEFVAELNKPKQKP